MDSSTIDTFKIPQPLLPQDSSNSTNIESSGVELDVKKEDKSVVQKVISKPAKSRVDVPLPYKEPTWSGSPPPNFSLEIIKNGAFLENYDIKNSLVVFGRLDVCNIVFEHPSVSRYHAVVQYCVGDSDHPEGFYLYDLGSTHGTFLNKQKVTPRVYYKLKVGYLIKFGGSTRLHIFQGPEEEVEETPPSTKVEEEVCTWGMGEDAEEEEDLSVNPFALSTPNEDLYLDDPKKTLRNWFEREGYELEYDVEEKGFKTFSCRIQLPIDTPTGEYMPIEASVSGKKKEAVIACALEACRTLDRLGLLRQSHQESRQKKKKKWEENDYYDSDEDTFLDRTGTIEKKREMRKRSEKKTASETYESIEAKLKAVTEEIDEITSKLSVSKSDTDSEKNSDVDTLEAYMSSLSNTKETAGDKIERRKLRYRLQEAEKEKAHLEKLLDIARPAKLPAIKTHPGMIGKRLKSKLQIPSTKPKEKPIQQVLESNEAEEEEESDSDMEENSSKETVASTEKASRHETNDESGKVKKYGLILDASNTDVSVAIAKETEPKKELQVHSKERVIGCKMPSTMETLISGGSSAKKKKKHDQRDKNTDVYSAETAEYSSWVPPSGQTGDGITHLNAKYGY